MLDSVDRINDHVAMLANATMPERKAQHIAAMLLLGLRICTAMQGEKAL